MIMYTYACFCEYISACAYIWLHVFVMHAASYIGNHDICYTCSWFCLDKKQLLNN